MKQRLAIVSLRSTSQRINIRSLNDSAKLAECMCIVGGTILVIHGAITERGADQNSHSLVPSSALQVQRLAANIDLGHTLFAALPSLLMAPFWGPWTDKAGRKHGLLAPCAGATLEATLVLLIMYFKWPLWVMFIGGAINGLSGFLTTMTLAVISFIADTTDKEARSFRLG